MEITTSTGTIAKLFYGNNEQFVIPAYQRRYSWQKKQISQLFNDMENLSEEETHFMGSVVCLAESHKAGINQLELVDGQQRMTTLVLILDTIKDRFEDLEEKREAERLEDLIYCRDSSCTENKLILGDLDADDFKKIINREDLNHVKNGKLLEAYETIKNHIDNYDTETLINFKEKLLNRTAIVRLDVSRAKDAFKLFETINNRGLSLSATDIIKNFLLGHASMIDDSTLERVKKEWTEIILNMDGQNLDDFFRQYLSGKLGRKVTFTMLSDTFKKYYISSVSRTEILTAYNGSDEVSIDAEDLSSKKLTPIEFLAELREASSVYSRIINRSFESKKVNRAINDLRRINSFPSYTFLLSLFRRNLSEDATLKILWLIEVFMMRRNVCEYRTAELDDIFAKLTKETDDDLYEKVKQTLIQHLPSDLEFEEKLPEQDFYGRFLERAKCILEAIEYKNTGMTGEKEIQGGSDVHLEHIIPQTINTKKSQTEFGDWIGYLGDNALENHNKLVNRIGNMTLLAGDLNIIASNNPFEAKKKQYVLSDIGITKELKDYSQFKFEELGDRSKMIARESVNIWSF